MKTVTGFIYLGSKITLDSADSCEKKKKKTLAPWKKSYEIPYSTLKSRDITLPANVCIVKAMVLPEIMSGCESWTIIKLSSKELMLLKCGVG